MAKFTFKSWLNHVKTMAKFYGEIMWNPHKKPDTAQFFGWISIESLRFQLQHLPVPTSWHLQSGRALLWVGVLGLAED